jgi:acyl transferase domain-containing protein/NAD(P)-dependent dehydrogenase (short-subunit alcohol dehydrogenase family)/acyl carrier protein
LNPADRTSSVPDAIIGMGCLFPKAENLSRYWANICQGVDAIREIPETHWNPDDYHDADPKSPDRTYARRGGFLDPVDFPALDFGIAPANLDATDTTQLLGLMVARAALEDAGYGTGGKPIDRERVSVVLGVTGTLELVIPLGARLGHPIWRRALKDCGVAEPVASQVVQRISDSYVGWQENSFPGLLGNVAAGRIANRLDLGGSNCVVDAACASSIAAVHLAILELAAGRCDVALTGGLDTFNDIFMFMCFSKTPALSPTGDSRPFSSNGDGTALGEGLGVLTLKRLEDARRDGDRIYAVIKGIGTSSDGKGNAVYAPSAEGQAKCLRRAYEAAGVSPDTIELVEAHGTGTKVGDAVELSALAEVYRSAKPDSTWCALGSVKSQIGHTKAAAGAAGLIKAALALYHKVLPPTIKIDRPAEGAAPGQTPFYVNTQARPWLPSPDHPRRAAVSAFGFGGSNFHAVLEEADSIPAPVAWTGDVQILAFSAPSPELIRKTLESIPLDASWETIRLEAARSRSSFQADAAERLVIVAERDRSAWPKLVERANALLDGATSSSPEAVFRGAGQPSGGLAVLFPGQGSQYVGMLRDLACLFPSLLETLAVAGLEAIEGKNLADWIYPHPVFDDPSRRALEVSLQATNLAQPAIGAVSLGAFRVLEEFGLKADAFAGHSFGELTALCASGRINERDFHDLARLRGSLMAGDGGDRGGMLAVLAPVEAVERMIADDKLDLVIANRNAPKQAVLSGPLAEIARAADAFSREAITTKPLDVSAAFHSRLVAGASGPLLEALAKVEVSSSAVPVFANTTASAYPIDPAETRTLLANQLAKPVRFVEQVEAMYRAGLRTFVEVGPDARLTGLVRSILDGRDHACFALDASKGARGNLPDLARTLAQLAALGHPLELKGWDAGAEAGLSVKKKPGLTVKVSGANFRAKPLPPVTPLTTGIHATPKRESPPKMTTKPDDRPAPKNPPQPSRNGNAPQPPKQVPSPVAAVPAPNPVAPSYLVEALRTSQENLVALQRISEQTSNLHRQFLEGQDRAQQSFQSLLEHQQRLTLAAIGMTPPPVPATYVPPTPLPIAAPSSPVVRKAPTPAARPAPAPRPAPVAVAVAVPKPAPVVAKAAPEPIPTPETHSNADEVHQALVEVVSEKTGYPAEVLEPGMHLDADLGIDSIKRVEILAALQERLPEAPVIGPEHLGTIRTLGQIAEFLAGGAEVAPIAVQPAPAKLPRPEPVAEPVRRLVPSVVTIDRLDDRPIVKLAADAEVWVLDDGSELVPALLEAFQKAGLRGRSIARNELATLASPAKLSGLVLLASGPKRSTMGEVFSLLRTASSGLRKGPSAFVTVSTLGGSFGLGGLASGVDPSSGGLAGLSKTAGHEWPEVNCKAIDLDPNLPRAQAAALIVDEMTRRCPVEVGLTSAGRSTIALRPIAIEPNSPVDPLKPGDLVLITGGARGVTADVAEALARAFRPTIAILGRSPSPTAEPDWLVSLTDEAEIKRGLHTRANGHSTPQVIGEAFRQVSANREILANLKRIDQAGAKVVYRSVDVRDAEAVRAVVDSLRAELGPIRGLIHGAGVLADRKIEDQTDEQFARVYDTKVGGLDALLGAIADDDLRALVLFSSSTARFGRNGQVAYAAANEVLNKRAQVEAKARPACRVIAPNWGPWAGGMVTPSLRPLFEAEGIALIPPSEGARYLVQELRNSEGQPVEVVILGGGGPDPEFLKPTTVEASEGLTSGLAKVFERPLDVASTPILESHVMDGRPVLPMALILEWLAQAAMTRNPGMVYCGVDGLRLLKGVVLRETLPETIRALAGKAVRVEGHWVVPVELRGVLADDREVLHARGQVVLGDAYPSKPAPAEDPSLPAYPSSVREIYRDLLFHGPDLQGIIDLEGSGDAGIIASVSAAPAPSEWVVNPLRNQWLTDPLALDCAFQMMILWSIERTGSGSLPTFIGRYRQFRRAFPSDGVRVVARVTEASAHKARADIDFLDDRGETVARIEDYECVIDASLKAAFRRNRAAQVESK